MKNHLLSLLVLSILLNVACEKKKESSTAESSQTYNITVATNARISFSNNVSANGAEQNNQKINTMTATGPTLCSSVVCFSATSLTGKYFGLGFLIQSAGNGMVAYFGQDTWSNITGTSTTYSFDASNPVVNSGTLFCCNGSGNLSSQNSYIESVIYLFSYLDATFTVSGITGNATMNDDYTVRFIFATDAITSAVRGDLLIKDEGLPAGQGGSNDGVFKWVSISTGALSATRPADPVTMNSSVTNYVNPFGPGAGNQEIPVLYIPVYPVSGSGLFTISESDLSIADRTYNFKFDPTNLIMFPTFINSGSDINSIFSIKSLLQNIHLGGLPHSQQAQGVGSPAATILTTSP